ncbi:phosphotransferase [Halorubellus sp. PRR65]|uniref:phosphotransferase family protein n=1 Tax=Halorubellus sp. PRR65 TaxID=3098148 RepID=UPI002B260C1C|nr:phosphotransferase [Halorubellus sp. PRR65]
MPFAADALALDDVRRILAHLDVVADPVDLPATALTAVGDGVNDVLVVDPPHAGAERFVLKVGTFSHPEHLRGGVAAARALRAYTTLPVPAVLGFDPGSDDRPPAVATEHCDGDPLARDFDDVENLTDPARVSLLGAVVAAFDALPADAATGWGNVKRDETVDGRPHLTAGHDAFDEWVAAYATKHFESPVDHPAIERVAPDALEYFRANRHRLPSDPSPSIVVTDLSPGNLLAPDGRPPASVDGLAGVVDLERAKLGPVAFTATNLEYLLTSAVDEPTPVRDALYEPLPFGPTFPLRDLYRLVAVSRAVSGLDTWEDPETDAFDRRARAVARELERIID